MAPTPPEAETIRKMILAMAQDLRVLVIKLADRVHNLRTLGSQPPHKQERIARATLDVLVPLADRLVIQVFKRELEDLAFATLEPAAHEAATVLFRDRAAQLDAYLGRSSSRSSRPCARPASGPQ